MTMDDSEYKIVDDEPKINEFNGKGFKVVVKTVSTAPAFDTDPERDVTEFFRGRDGKCIICELRCEGKDCTECDVPKYSEKITTSIMERITTHKPQFPGTGSIKFNKIE